MQTYDKIYVDGAWTESTGSGSIEVINSSTEEVMGSIPEGTAEDVDTAVAAARKAFPGWAATSREERGKYIKRLSEEIGARNGEIAETIAKEVGMPMFLAQLIQAGMPQAVMGSYESILDSYQFEEQVGNSLVVKEPVGVVGCITPWNYPLHQIVAKVAPAFAAGCTVVLKPSEVAPLNAFILAEIIDSVGLPAGVFNLVSGDGPTVGAAISEHPDIDMVSFTGSTRAGKLVAKAAADTVKRVALELGGKSPNLILDDADFDAAVRDGVGKCYLNSGQTCTALTRMLVPAGRMEEAAEIARNEAEANYRLTDPVSGDGRLGPLVSETQRDRVRGYIEKGIEEGANLVLGGADAPEEFAKGFYVKPTIFSGVSNEMTIAREEIFGPVLSIIGYEDEDDGIAKANDTQYGLAAAVWSGDLDRAKRVAGKIRAGQVEVNGGSFNPMAPFGGYKQSGHGRELGKYGLEEFLEVKSMQL